MPELTLGLAIIGWVSIFLVFSNRRYLNDGPSGLSAKQIKPSLDLSSEKPVTISVIIPARNEAKNLQRLLPSIQNQTYTAYETIVVNDQSTDSTARIAQQNGAQVIDLDSLPQGWRGKTWACHQGALHASGQYLLFLDADVWLEPEALEHYMRQADLKTVSSVLPYHQTQAHYEGLSLFFNIMMAMGSGAFAIPRQGQNSQTGLFGQSLWISSQLYRQCGGYQLVAHELLENVALRQHLARQSINSRGFLGRGSVNMRMYPFGLGSLVSGWLKAFHHGAHQTPAILMLLIVLWLSGMTALSIAMLAQIGADDPGLAGAFIALYFLFAGQLWLIARALGRFPLWSVLVFPLSLLFFHIIFSLALLGPKLGLQVQWKGRTVD